MPTLYFIPGYLLTGVDLKDPDDPPSYLWMGNHQLFTIKETALLRICGIQEVHYDD